MSDRVRARGGKGRTGTERERRKGVLVALMTELFDQSVTVTVVWWKQKCSSVICFTFFSFCPFIILVFAFVPSLMMCSTFPWLISFLSLSFSISSFSNRLQQLIFFIGHLDCSSLSSFTNQGPFVWKHENPNMQHTPVFSGSLEKLFWCRVYR